MNNQEYSVRNAFLIEFTEIGKLMVKVYSQLEGFPKENGQYTRVFHITCQPDKAAFNSTVTFCDIPGNGISDNSDMSRKYFFIFFS